MKQLLLLTIFMTFLGACSPKIKSTITSKQTIISNNDPVIVLNQDELFDNVGIEVGTVKSGDNVLSSNCSYNEILEILIQLAKQNGANILKIKEHKVPDIWSTCDRITAVLYKVPNYRKYEKEIVWSPNRKLTWDDFKGLPLQNSITNIAATTYCGFEFNSNRVTLFKKANVYIKNIFDCRLSWVKQDQVGSLDLLEHEQIHFDLCEVYTRILRKKIKEKKLTAFNLIKETNKIYDETYDQYIERQEIYEKETNHGLNRQKQIEWTKKIEEELKELDSYS